MEIHEPNNQYIDKPKVIRTIYLYTYMYISLEAHARPHKPGEGEAVALGERRAGKHRRRHEWCANIAVPGPRALGLTQAGSPLRGEG